jgi:RNA recognition motif-containing protein
MNIYVGNLSRQVTAEDLKTAFGQFGEVQTASVIKDKFTGEPRGFGFVDMPTKTEAVAAISALNRKDLKGQALKVNEARAKNSSGGGNRRGAGGFNGGGGWTNGNSGGHDRKRRGQWKGFRW